MADVLLDAEVRNRTGGGVRSVNRSLGGIGAGLRGGPLGSLIGPLAAAGGIAGLLTINREQQQVTLALFAGLTSDQGSLAQFRDLVNDIAGEFGALPGTVAAVVANLGTSFGLLATDPDLTLLTKAFIALQDAGAGSAAALSQQLGPAIAGWDIQAAEALGVSLTVSRETGIPLPQLLGTLINQSPRIKEIFPTFEDAALAIGLFHKEGVPAERALIGFSTALKELTKEEAVQLLDDYRLGLVDLDDILKVFGEEGGRAVAKLAQSESWPQIRAAILGVSVEADMMKENGVAAIEELVRVAEGNVDPFAVAMRQIQNALIGPATALGNFVEAATSLLGGDFAGAGRALQSFSSALLPDNIEGTVIGGARNFFRGALGLFGQEDLVPPTNEELARAERTRLDAIVARNNQRFLRGEGVYGPEAPAVYGPQQPNIVINTEGYVDSENIGDILRHANQIAAQTGNPIFVPSFQ